MMMLEWQIIKKHRWMGEGGCGHLGSNALKSFNWDLTLLLSYCTLDNIDSLG